MGNQPYGPPGQPYGAPSQPYGQPGQQYGQPDQPYDPSGQPYDPSGQQYGPPPGQAYDPSGQPFGQASQPYGSAPGSPPGMAPYQPGQPVGVPPFQPAGGSDLARTARKRGIQQIAGGAVLFVIGLIITVATYSSASSSRTGGTYFVAYGPMIFGVIGMIRGAIALARAKRLG